MIILGIETSCDDTCAAIIKATGSKKSPRFEILSNVRSSQTDIHQEFGGIVPHLAARAHADNMGPVLKATFKKARIPLKDAKRKIDLITVTSHPGLIPCLLIGTNVAKTLSWAWQKPIIGVNHLEGHVYINWLDKKPKPTFPALSLIVSGGHTQLVLMKKMGDFKIIGETRDDAAGEAFDKVAKLVGLPFPGGPPISKEAEKVNNTSISLPRPMIHSNDYDFSFSGLKTAVLYLVKDRYMKHGKLKITSKERSELAKEFQQAVIDVLISKTIRAAKQYKVKTVILGGGVAANKELNKQLKISIKKELPKTIFLSPPPALSTDNAAMIAVAGYFNFLEGKSKTWRSINARAVL